jgi:hypothetical protein
MLDAFASPWILLLLWLAANALILAYFRRDLRRLWREPVVWPPTLVLESDDWGAGPVRQAAALDDIAGLMRRHKDASGHPPVMSLALVLAVPDGPATAAQGRYRRSELDNPRFAPILASLRQGMDAGVLALQLHGLEHYWPVALMNSGDAQVQAWVRQPDPAATEQLPSPLQSRWVDASSLPSAPHAAAAIAEAVADEVQVYTRIFGQSPSVVVPPTFVWTREVEAAWVRHGVEFVVTPGRRYVCRGADGLPGGDEGPIETGESVAGVTYLVRSDYFEPARGRGAAHALRALGKAALDGRPCILENHRDNFLDPALHARSLAELEALLTGALAAHPQLRFLSTADLGHIIRRRDPRWIVTGARTRLPYLMNRLRHAGRPWKLMKLSGLAVVLTLTDNLISRPTPAPQAGHAPTAAP